MADGYSLDSKNDIASQTSTAFNFGDGGDIIFGDKETGAPVNNTMLYVVAGGFAVVVLILLLRR